MYVRRDYEYINRSAFWGCREATRAYMSANAIKQSATTKACMAWVLALLSGEVWLLTGAGVETTIGAGVLEVVGAGLLGVVGAGMVGALGAGTGAFGAGAGMGEGVGAGRG